MGRVLIAEDDRCIAKIIAKAVESAGHIAFISPNGVHALTAIQSNDNFDMLITDVMMPEMNGTDLVCIVRGSTKGSDMPIIIMSAVTKQEEIDALLSLGVSKFRAKPISIKDLREDVLEFLGAPEDKNE